MREWHTTERIGGERSKVQIHQEMGTEGHETEHDDDNIYIKLSKFRDG